MNAISISTVWCCAHSAQRCHLFLFTSINGKKPPRLLLATRYTRRKQQPLPRHGGLSVRGACCRCVVQRPGLRSPHATARWGAAAPQKEARWLQIWQDTGRGLLFNGNALRHWIFPRRCCNMLLFWLMYLNESSSGRLSSSCRESLKGGRAFLSSLTESHVVFCVCLKVVLAREHSTGKEYASKWHRKL